MLKDMKSVVVSEMKPEYRVAIFVSLVRAEYALSYTMGALSKMYDEYRHLLKQRTKKRFNAYSVP